MRVLRTAFVAGVAALAVGLSGAAAAQTSNVVNVRLPGGGIAEIHYAGSVPPQVYIRPAPALVGASMPASSLFGPGSPFAMFERISAEMDRQAAAMFRYAEALAAEAQSGRLTEAAWRRLPAGSQGYSFVSAMSGNGVCTRSVQITSLGDGAPPRVERYSVGDCGPSAAAPGPAVTRPMLPPRPAPAQQPDLILTQDTGGNPRAAFVRQVAAATPR